MKGVLCHLIKRKAQKPGGEPSPLDQAIGAIPLGDAEGIEIQLFLGAVVEADYKGLFTTRDQLGPLHEKHRILHLQVLPLTTDLYIIPILIEMEGCVKERKDIPADDLPPLEVPHAVSVDSDG